jgi:hypothetical protein
VRQGTFPGAALGAEDADNLHAAARAWSMSSRTIIEVS